MENIIDMENIIGMFDKLGITVILDENEVMHFFNKDTKKKLQTKYIHPKQNHYYENTYNLSSMINTGAIVILDCNRIITFSLQGVVVRIEKNGDTPKRKRLLLLDEVSVINGLYENGEFIKDNTNNYSVKFFFDFILPLHDFDINKGEFDSSYVFTPDINNMQDNIQTFINNIIIKCKKGDDRIKYGFYSNGMAFIEKNRCRIDFENVFQEGSLSKNDACEIIKNDDLLPIFVDYFAKTFPAAKKCIESVNENSKKFN